MRHVAVYFLLMFAGWVGCLEGAAAQGRTEQPVRILVGFAAGGVSDILARMTAARMQEVLSRPVIVENRVGAGGNLAAAAVARSRPDGHTLLAASTSILAINPLIYPDTGLDRRRDFTPVGVLVTIPNVLIVHPGLPVRSIAEFGIHFTAQQDLPCGSPGIGTSQHLGLLMLMQQLGAECRMAHYRGGSTALPDLQAGRVLAAFDSITSGMAQAQAGNVRLLGVTSQMRAAIAPGLPAIAETVPGFEATTWAGLVAPAGTPDPVLERFAGIVRGMVEDPSTAARLRQMGTHPIGFDRGAMARLLDEEDDKWGPLVRRSGARVE